MHLYANTHVDRQVEKSIKNVLLVYIKLSNTLQFLYKPQFGQPWRRNIMFKALKVANKNKKLNIFLFFLYQYGMRLSYLNQCDKQVRSKEIRK